MTLREPTKDEKEQLIAHITQERLVGEVADTPHAYREAVEDLVAVAAIAVFDDYSTGGPGYVGKVMVVVWDGGPDQTDTFIWERTAAGHALCMATTRTE